MAKKKCYAVKKGASPGIYATWAETEAQVKGYPGAKFKGFASREDAVKWLESDVRDTPTKTTRKKKVRSVVPQVEEGGVIVYTDGGAINNPGPGGYGAVICRDGKEEELSGGYGHTTNNRMELMAVIVALRRLQQEKRRIHLHSDSSYVVNSIEKKWILGWQRNDWHKADGKPVLNKDLWLELIRLREPLDVRFVWVKGHAGNPLNERCDRLAVAAARGQNLPDDLGYIG